MILFYDCTMVLDAKLKNGEIIGKVRIAPRGFRDHGSCPGQGMAVSPSKSLTKTVVQCSAFAGIDLKAASS